MVIPTTFMLNVNLVIQNYGKEVLGMVKKSEVIRYLRDLADRSVGVDFDGSWGWQCVDASNKTYNMATGKVLAGNAIDLADSARAQGTTVIDEGPGVYAKAGDIFVMAVPGSIYGHTGVVIADSDGYTISTIEQNVDGNADFLEVGGPARYRTRTYNGMVAFIRPNYDSETDSEPKQTGWIEDSNGWWYQEADGSYPSSGWREINGSYFYFDDRGYILTNKWYQDKAGYWYWLKSGGHMAKGWEQINGKWYFFNNNGEMKTGWVQYFDKWYYLDAVNGDMISKEARLVDGKYYYFNSKGEMLERAAIYVDENGAVHFED